VKLKEKVVFSMFGLLIFFISGAVACTYGNTGILNPVLVAILGILVFFTTGAAACTYGNNRTVEKKPTQILPKTSEEA
jgi:hypothetical protein